MPKVTIVILNWNGKKWLEQFLPSVIATEYEDYEILLADNASTDDSLTFVKSHFPEVKILVLDENYGFAEGNNRAIPHVDSPYVLLLNSDVEVTPGWLGPMVEMMDSDESIASIQPKVLMWHDKTRFEYAGAAGGYLDRFCYPFCRGRMFDFTEVDEGQYDDAREIFWATGACCLIRKSVIEEIGLFERAFFAHMEEIDFCWRARNFGYKIMYQPESAVYHVGGGTLNRSSPRKTFLNVHNSLAMMYKNLPSNRVFVKILIRLILDGVWGIKSVLELDLKTPWAIIKAHLSLYANLRFWHKRRKEVYEKIDQPKLEGPGYFPNSIVWQYFVKRKKSFNDLIKKTPPLS